MLSSRKPLVLAAALAVAAALALDRVSPPPVAWLDKFGESSVDFVIHCWINDPEEGVGNVRSEVLKRIWAAFQENGIEIPFAQRDLNLRDNPQFQRLVEALTQRTKQAEG